MACFAPPVAFVIGTRLRRNPAKRSTPFRCSKWRVAHRCDGILQSGALSVRREVSRTAVVFPDESRNIRMGRAVKLCVLRGEIAPSFSRSLPAIPPGSLWRTMHASEKKKGLIQKILALQKEVCYHFASLRPLAQLVEHDTFNVGVAGSIPARPTILAPCKLLAWGFFIVFSCRLNARFADIFTVTLRGL